ncbi:MAG: CCA tRNA nucleotidyltransferase, partial [Hyphomicrobiaceae bacterium]|nr:CCA tRNA nucleotidyltransferase [Hyphomicrobiaceae bacterium]
MSVAIPKISDPWLSSSSSCLLEQMFADSAYTARFVGGVVRNALLGEAIHDFDVATDAPPEHVMELAQKAGFKAIGTGLAHGTVTIVIKKVVFEVTTLRVDMQTDGRHAQVAFTDDWRKDAARRDFTMNALYADFDGTIFDPLDGYEDLLARRVRFIGCAGDRISEDFLRILRFFRFNAQYGEGALDEPGLSACVRLQAGLSGLSGERIGAEFLRLLVAKNAGPVLKVMFAHGLILPLTGLVPQLHRFGNWLELERALDRSPDAIERLGALFMLAPGNENRLAARLRLSNRQKYAVQLWSRAVVLHRKMSESAARLALYKLGGDYQMSIAI